MTQMTLDIGAPVAPAAKAKKVAPVAKKAAAPQKPAPAPQKPAAKPAKAKPAKAKPAAKAETPQKPAKAAPVAPAGNILETLRRHREEIAAFAPTLVKDRIFTASGAPVDIARIGDYENTRRRHKAEIVSALETNAQGVFKTLLIDSNKNAQIALFRLNIAFEVDPMGNLHVPLFGRPKIYAAWIAACRELGVVAPIWGRGMI